MCPFQTNLTLNPPLSRHTVCKCLTTNQSWPDVIIRIIRIVISVFDAFLLPFCTTSFPFGLLSRQILTLFLRPSFSGGARLELPLFWRSFSNGGSRWRISGILAPFTSRGPRMGLILLIRTVFSGGSMLKLTLLLNSFTSGGSRFWPCLSVVWPLDDFVSFCLKWIFIWWTHE